MVELRLGGLAVDCVIGDLPDEREREQRLVLDVALELADGAKADETDSLADTVDYAALADSIRRTLVAARCRMIERAARIAADLCLAEPLVRRARVRVTKAGAVPGLASASACVVAEPGGPSGKTGASRLA